MPDETLPTPLPLPSTPQALTSLLTTIASTFVASKGPLHRYLHAAELALPNDSPVTLSQAVSCLKPSVEKAISQNAQVLVIPSSSSNNHEGGQTSEKGPTYAAAATYFTPAHPRGPRASTSESPRPHRECADGSEAVQKAVLTGRKYYYVHIIVRAPENKTPGAVTALMRWALDRAKEENVPVYLDAINAHARDVYAHFGFKVCGEWVVGRGEVDDRGFWVAPEKGGNGSEGVGVKVWSMIWEPGQ